MSDVDSDNSSVILGHYFSPKRDYLENVQISDTLETPKRIYRATRSTYTKHWSIAADAQARKSDSVYSELLATYRAYGGGYTDAARRYANVSLLGSSDKNEHFKAENNNMKSERLVYSRSTFFLFTCFLVLLIVSVVAAIGGKVSSSSFTVEFSVYLLGGSLASGLAWLGRAELERNNATDI